MLIQKRYDSSVLMPSISVWQVIFALKSNKLVLLAPSKPVILLAFNGGSSSQYCYKFTIIIVILKLQ